MMDCPHCGGDVSSLMKDTCEDCGVVVPRGQGIGVSGPEEEWIDRSKPRSIVITPLCMECLSKRFVES